MIRAVIFDWGGTLTPWHDIDLVAQWQAYVDVYRPDDTELAQRLMAAETRLWRDQQATNGEAGTGSLDHIWASAGVDTDSPLHLEAMATYLRAWDPHTVADPLAHPTLAALRDRGLMIGVLSNTMWPRAHHQRVFDRDQLLPLNEAAVYSSEIPVAKPHLDAFRSVLEILEVRPSEAVFVGDRPWDDIHGAQQVGMRAIWIPHSRLGDQAVDVDVSPDAVAATLADTVNIVDAWMAADSLDGSWVQRGEVSN